MAENRGKNTSSIIELSPDHPRLYMRYDKILPSAQGMAVYGDMAFILYHTGVCALYDLKTRDPKPLARFPLGSYNSGVPARDYLNHSNQCMFSGEYLEGNTIPLLYVTCGCGVGRDQDGFFYRCAVEDVHVERMADGRCTRAESRLIQTLVFSDEDIGKTSYEKPCWGCPAWFVDSANDCLYIFSSRWRTTKEFLEHYNANRYIITKMRKPPLVDAFVRLTAADILDQFLVPFDILFTQGGMISGDKMFYTFGLGDNSYPIGLRVYDLTGRCVCGKVDLSGSIFGHEEIESCSFYNGELFCNTNTNAGTGGIYSLGTNLAKLL